MRKRLIFIAVIAISAIAIYTVLHSKYKNENIKPMATIAATEGEPSSDPLQDRELSSTTTVAYKEASSYLKTQSGKVLLFLADENQDTEFILTSVLTPLVNQFDNPINTEIIHITMLDTEDVSVVNLQKAFKVESYPSFILVDANDKGYTVISTLTFESDDPFNSEDLKTWLFENGLWTGPYGNN